jgi:hypothetical protein
MQGLVQAEEESCMNKAAEIDIVSVSKIYGTTTAVDTISLKIPAGASAILLLPISRRQNAEPR